MLLRASRSASIGAKSSWRCLYTLTTGKENGPVRNLLGQTQCLKPLQTAQQPLSKAYTLTYRRLNSTSSAGATAASSFVDSIQVPPDQDVKASGKKRRTPSFPSKVPRDSEWFNQINAFDDCLNQAMSVSRANPFTRNPGSVSAENRDQLLFWDSVQKVVSMYHDLLPSGLLDAPRVSTLVNVLHNGLRINRSQLIKLSKKPDYDARSFNSENNKFLTQTLREVCRDLLEGRVTVNEYGAMHLLTSLRELQLEDEATELWKLAINDKRLTSLFLQPKVVGAILPLLYGRGKLPFDECKKLYFKSASTIDFSHPNLLCGYLDTCLLANENEEALKVYSTLCEICNANQFNYLADAHLSIMGKCRDINVARTFYRQAIEGELPYRIPLQVSHVNSFLQNIWSQTREYTQVEEVYLSTLSYYKNNPKYKNRNILGILSSLNKTHFQIFFENYSEDPLEGYKNLQHLVNKYSQINGTVDEPFLNIILTDCTLWQKREVLQSILELYPLYNVPETIITKRIVLKAMGSLNDIETSEIVSKWKDLILKLDQMGQTYIANADWAALRDATVKWASEREQESNDGQQVDKSDIEARLLLYVKVLKMYLGYCRDQVQVERITRGCSVQFPALKPFLDKMDTIPTDDIEMVPELRSLTPMELRGQ